MLSNYMSLFFLSFQLRTAHNGLSSIQFIWEIKAELPKSYQYSLQSECCNINLLLTDGTVIFRGCCWRLLLWHSFTEIHNVGSNMLCAIARTPD